MSAEQPTTAARSPVPWMFLAGVACLFLAGLALMLDHAELGVGLFAGMSVHQFAFAAWGRKHA